MTAVLEMASARPTWRYRDDAPPVNSPSRKRRLGAALAYLAVTTGVGAAIFWPSNDQALAISEFKIPPSPFTASVASGTAPQPSPASVPEPNRLVAASNRPLRSVPNQSKQYLRPASSTGRPTTVAVVTPGTPPSQGWVPESHARRSTTPASATSRPTESQTTPDQTETRQRPWSRGSNPDADPNHPFDGGPSNSGTTKPTATSTPRPDSTPTPDIAPKTPSDNLPASSPNAADNAGIG